MAVGDIIGYTEAWSGRPGDRLRVAVSCNSPRYRAELVRLRRGGPRPGGEEHFRFDRVEAPINGDHDGRAYPFRRGSFAYTDDMALLADTGGATFKVRFFPTVANLGRPQGLLGYWSPEESAGMGLFLDAAGALSFRWSDERGERREAAVDAACDLRRWYDAIAVLDHEKGSLLLEQRPLKPLGLERSAATLEVELGGTPTLPRSGRLCFGAGRLKADPWREQPYAEDGFNGKIERPAVAAAAIDAAGRDELRGGADLAAVTDEAVADWDLGIGIDTDRATDQTGNGVDATLANRPTRAVTGHNWTGRELDWRHAPDQYAAVHFHDDDMAGAGWPWDLDMAIPDGLESGPYAVRIAAGSDEEFLPFFILPEERKKKIAFLAPTLTYIAYSNYGTASIDVSLVTGAPPVQSDSERFVDAHPELGLSLYNHHTDGSGISLISMQRPMLNIRPQAGFILSDGGGWAFSGDMFLIDWMEQAGYEYDVITDHDLHREGLGLIEDYEVVISGMHPEYVTDPELTAIEEYLEQGGRFMYLGGNGFYWPVTIGEDDPDVIELRRGVNGTAPWRGEPGEHHHSMTGEPGGLWRYRGRAPQKIFGVGMCSEGGGGSASYLQVEGRDDPRAAFIFDGVDADEVIGDFGNNKGGAAGDETDRVDYALGTPPHALLLATSSGRHSNYYQRAIEEIFFTAPTYGGQEDPEVRADIVYFETPDGGAVFSVGSIDWTASLSHDGYDNNVSRITHNVLRAFSEGGQ